MPEEAVPFLMTRGINELLHSSYSVEEIMEKLEREPKFVAVTSALRAALSWSEDG